MSFEGSVLPVVKIVAALLAIGVGTGPAFISILSQVVDSASSTPSTWAQLGGVTVAMGALAYVAKRFADGSIVARPVNEVLDANAKREDQYKAMLEDANKREDGYRSLLLRDRQANKEDRDRGL